MNLLENKKLLRTLLAQGDFMNTVHGGVIMPAVSEEEKDNEHVIKVSAPTVSPEAYNIILNNGSLIIYIALKHADKEGFAEMPMFIRSFDLPHHINADAIEAVHENGELRVFLPYDESYYPKKRRINIKSL